MGHIRHAKPYIIQGFIIINLTFLNLIPNSRSGVPSDVNESKQQVTRQSQATEKNKYPEMEEELELSRKKILLEF